MSVLYCYLFVFMRVKIYVHTAECKTGPYRTLSIMVFGVPTYCCQFSLVFYLTCSSDGVLISPLGPLELHCMAVLVI